MIQVILPSFLSSLGQGFLKNDILCIDIGFTNIKVVHSRKKKNGSLKILNFGIGNTPDGCIKNGVISDLRGIAENIKKVIDNQKINQKNVKIVISAGSNIVSKIVYIQNSEEKSLEERIRSELSDQSVLDISTQKIFYRIVGETVKLGHECSKVLVTIVPKKIYENYVKLLELLRFKPVAIDIPFSSMARFFSKSIMVPKQDIFSKSLKSGDSKYSTAVVDLGSETTNLSIINKGALDFNRIFLIGGRRLDYNIGSRLEVDQQMAERYKMMYGVTEESYFGDEVGRIVTECCKAYIEEIVDNLKRCIEFYVNRCEGNMVERIFFVGGGSGMKGLKSFAESKIGVPVYTFDNIDFQGIEFEPHLDKEKIRFLVNAVGLAM